MIDKEFFRVNHLNEGAQFIFDQLLSNKKTRISVEPLTSKIYYMIAQIDWLLLIDQTEDAFNHLKLLFEQGHTSVRFLPDAVQERKLWSIYWEQRSAQRLKGQQLLYFQYPFFQHMTEEGKTLEPLLRWPSQLEPPVKGSGYWTLNIQGLVKTDISYALSAKAGYNKKWCTWANKNSGYEWEQALEACLQTKENGLKALSALAQAMMEKTDWQTATVHPALRSLNSINLDKSNDPTSDLLWLATLGVSSEQWDIDVDEDEIDWREKTEKEESFLDQLNLLKLDPFQYQSLNIGNNHRFTKVSGRQSSGKTHTIVEGIKVNLLSEKPCLIVAREKTSLSQIKSCLEKHKLGDLVLHWHNEATDFAVFKANIQTSNKKTSSISAKEMNEWTAALGRQNRIRRSLGELYTASRKPVFTDISWSALLGYYLRESRKEGKELLASQLSAAHFQFTVEEHNEIKSAINKTKPLYDVLGNIHHPLSNLNAAIFVHQNLEESKAFIHQITEQFLTTAKTLHQNYVRRQSQYADQLATHYESYYIELREQSQHVAALLEDAENEFGADLLASGENTLKLYGRFSKRFKKADDQRAEIMEAYEKLQGLHDKMTAFSFEWPVLKVKKTLAVLGGLLQNYQSKLENWRTTFSSKISDELIRLNHKTALDSLRVSSSILPIEQEFEIFIDEVNASGLYQLPLHSKTLTLSKQQKYLEEIIGQLERSRGGLLHYDTFYNWQRNWFSLTETARKTIQALLRSLPDDWIAAFSSWYLNECLSREYHPFPIVTDAAIAEYPDQMNSLRTRLSDVIHKTWETKHNSALTKLKSISKNKANSTVELLKQGGQYVASVYPIALASPEIARLLAPYYQVVYLDNAQTLAANAIIPVAEYDVQMMTFVDEQEIDFQPDGIAQLLDNKGVVTTTLENSYELNFAQQAMSLSDNIVFYELEGRFDEEDQSNEVEALAVLRILNSIKKTPQQTYPTVGVICMTKGQRNRIQELFYRIKKDRHTGVEMLQQLERNGLRVFTGDEVIGQNFDHIIFSAVHGPIDIKGHLSPMLSTLNEGTQMASLTALETLIGPNTKWDVLSSMPKEELKVRTSWSDKKGEQRFGLLLELFHNIAKGDFDAAFSRSKSWETAYHADNNQALEIELKHRLSEQLPDWAFDIVKPKEKAYSFLQATSSQGTKVALLTDGFLAFSNFTTIDWEQEQQQHLKIDTYKIISFSSESLWKDPSFTCLRLVNQLKSLAGADMEEE